MSLRILLASDYYPPYIGGAHRQTQLLAHELQRRGHEVSVVTAWHGGQPEEELEDNVRVFRLKQLRTCLPGQVKDRKQRHQPPFPDPITVFGLRRLIKRLQPDVIHAYGWFSYSIAVALLGLNVPLLISGRDYGYTCATRTLVYKGDHLCAGPALTKCPGCAVDLYGTPKGWAATLGVMMGRSLLRRKVHGIHSISTYVQEIFRRDFLDQRPPDRIPGNKIIIEAIIPSFREDDLNRCYGEDPRIQSYVERLPSGQFMLYVGALRRIKGVDQLLAAYTRLASPPPLVLIGTVEHDSPREYPPGVSVLQNFPHDAVMAAWERCLFGVTPSLLPEPLGSVVYEGMSRGKAVIGTRPGGHTDMIVDGETGLLVPSGDVDRLAEAMTKLIDQAELRERLGLVAKERAKQFTAGIAVPQFEVFYQRVIHHSAGHAAQDTDAGVLHRA